MEATILFPGDKSSYMVLPLTDGKAIVSKHTLEQRLLQIDGDRSKRVVGLQITQDTKMMDMYDGGDGMQFFILDARVSLVYKVCVMDMDVSPQASIQVRTCNENSQNGRHSKSQSSSAFQLGTSILSPIPICDDSPIDDCVSQPGACVLSPCNSMSLEVSPLMAITLSPLRNEDLLSSSRELSGSSLPPPDSLFFIDPLNKEIDPSTLVEATSQSMEGSVIKVIREKERSSTLRKILDRCERIERVLEIPKEYDGNLVFEFPPALGKASHMDGMEAKYDGHMWTKPRTSRQAFDGIVRLSYCVGALRCDSSTCSFAMSSGKQNVRAFKGTSLKKCSSGFLVPKESSIVCFYCQSAAFCYDTCEALVYYVMPRDTSLTRLMIHVGKHHHPSQPGCSRLARDRVKAGVMKVLAADRTATPRKVQMAVARDIFMEAFMVKHKLPSHDLDEKELAGQLEEIIPLISTRG